jgi:hypothetical protein
MSYPGRVRIAEQKDEEELMTLCRNLSSENAMFEVNDDKVRAMLRKAFNREGGVLGAIGEPGKIEGMIYMLVSTFWYSDQPHLEELFAYVVPEYRKSKNAVELMKFAKWCSDQSGFPLVIGVISNERTEGKVRLYQRQFSKPIGNFFWYKKAKKER